MNLRPTCLSARVISFHCWSGPPPGLGAGRAGDASRGRRAADGRGGAGRPAVRGARSGCRGRLGPARVRRVLRRSGGGLDGGLDERELQRKGGAAVLADLSFGEGPQSLYEVVYRLGVGELLQAGFGVLRVAERPADAGLEQQDRSKVLHRAPVEVSQVAPLPCDPVDGRQAVRDGASDDVSDKLQGRLVASHVQKVAGVLLGERRAV